MLGLNLHCGNNDNGIQTVLQCFIAFGLFPICIIADVVNKLYIYYIVLIYVDVYV